tara:strand:- start:1607 stop:1789 length:183 start_codon:yes stop_codon:yes gene_type:complete
MKLRFIARRADLVALVQKWAGFTIPVVINTQSNTLYAFDKKPMWGRIYYPHFEKLIHGLE